MLLLLNFAIYLSPVQGVVWSLVARCVQRTKVKWLFLFPPPLQGTSHDHNPSRGGVSCRN